MKRLMILAMGSTILAAPLYAALQVGAQAPDFTTQATLAGKPFKFALADALKSGPVVLDFYPAAFTPGCTVEAHEFAANLALEDADTEHAVAQADEALGLSPDQMTGPCVYGTPGRATK